MHDTEQLRVLTLADSRRVDELVSQARIAHDLDARSVAIARLGALVAHGGSVSSYGSEIEAALAAAAPSELVGALLAVASVVGVPCIVTAAPAVGLALGYDTEAALEQRDSSENGH